MPSVDSRNDFLSFTTRSHLNTVSDTPILGIDNTAIMSSTQTETMKAVNYQGAFKVKVEEVPMPKIEHPDDIIVKVTTAAICGSDLHMYEGRTGAQAGITFGTLLSLCE